MRSLLIFFGVFAAIGSICFIVTVVTFYSTIKRSGSWVEAKGTISGFTDSPIVTFDYYGQEQQFRSAFSSSDMRVGDEVTVHFPPDQPQEAEIKSFFTQWFLPMFFSIFALVFGGIGFIGGAKQLRRFNAKRDLFTYGKGRKTTLPVTDIILDTSFKVNGRSPYRIMCQYHDAVSNTVYEFKSDHIWYNPSELLKDRKEIDIYVDPNDLTYYYMDTSFLPKKA
jgi:hypothetical protein